MTEAQQRGTSKPGDPFAHVWNNGENHIERPCFMARNTHHLLWVMIIVLKTKGTIVQQRVLA